MRERVRGLWGAFGLILCMLCLCVSVSAECNHVYEVHEIPAGCVTPGVHEELCTYCGALGVFSNLEPLGHDFTSWEQILRPGCTEKGKEQRKCTRCDFLEGRSIEAVGHQYVSEMINPTCTKEGYTSYRCTQCRDSYRDAETPALGHQYVSEVINPTCTKRGYTSYRCTQCRDSYRDVETPASGHQYVSEVINPTCTKRGYTSYCCTQCRNSYRDAETPALGHQYVSEIINPTCTKEGYTSYRCTQCRDTYQEAETQALGHNYDHGVLTKEPTTTAMGRITYTCLNCGDTYQETTPKLTNPFEDVKPKNYFYNSVLWAANMGITSGVDMTHFVPNQTCTRGQVMVFLWRAMGSPEPASSVNPFVDVQSRDYFAKAVLWAYHAGVTAGVDKTHFGPNNPCTRAQVVTFLYSAKGRPAHSGEKTFYDVGTGAYYYNPVIWAAENGITTGVGDGMFGPNQRCSRGQIVTFLYQARNV